MTSLVLVPMDDTVVFPTMDVTLPVDVGDEDRVLLIPRHDNAFAKVGTIAAVTESVRLPGGARAVQLSGVARGIAGAAHTDHAGRLRVEVTESPDDVPVDGRTRNLEREYRAVVEEILELRGVDERVGSWLRAIGEPGALADTVGYAPDVSFEEMQGERVQHRGQHPHVVAGCPVHPARGALDAAVDVAGADDHRDLDAAIADRRDLLGDALDLGAVGAVIEAPHQRLAGELQQDPPEAGSGERSPAMTLSSPTRKYEKRAMRTFSPVFAASSWRSSSIVFESCLSALTCVWSSRPTSLAHFASWPSTIFSTTSSGLPSSLAFSSKTRFSASRSSSGMSSVET